MANLGWAVSSLSVEIGHCSSAVWGLSLSFSRNLVHITSSQTTSHISKGHGTWQFSKALCSWWLSALSVGTYNNKYKCPMPSLLPTAWRLIRIRHLFVRNKTPTGVLDQRLNVTLRDCLLLFNMTHLASCQQWCHLFSCFMLRSLRSWHYGVITASQ